jgi:glycine cleavage system transcriptional repressor
MVASVGGTITDLTTRLVGSLYVLTAEVEIPAGAELGMLQRALEITAEELGVGVTLRAAESDDL